MTHELKIHPAYFKAVRSGKKTFEVRYNDRNYKVGDVLKLREWDGEKYTGRVLDVYVDYILNDPAYCKDNMVVMAIKLPIKHTKRGMTLDEVIEMLKEEYERARKQRYINDPLACALYRVWKKVDPFCKLKH